MTKNEEARERPLLKARRFGAFFCSVEGKKTSALRQAQCRQFDRQKVTESALVWGVVKRLW